MEKEQREMEIFQKYDVIYNAINCAWIVLQKNLNQLNNSEYMLIYIYVRVHVYVFTLKNGNKFIKSVISIEKIFLGFIYSEFIRELL